MNLGTIRGCPNKEIVSVYPCSWGAEVMIHSRLLRCALVGYLLILSASVVAAGQTVRRDDGFGPVVRAYLGYLRNEQEVVDDRASRHEVNAAYYRKNSNRISALRQMAMRIARESQNDYLPELEAVAADEFGLLFERPPRYDTLRVGEVLQTTFRYLGLVRSGEVFYVFARLDPYEQSELMEQTRTNSDNASNAAVSDPASRSKIVTRARRVSSPD